MLGGLKLPETLQTEPILETYAQLFQLIYGHVSLNDGAGCPFLGQIGNLMIQVEDFPAEQSSIWELWLLFLPVCAKHKQCVSCFQETDDEYGRGMKSLRRKVIESASQLIVENHRSALAIDEFTSPFIVTVKTFTAGCVIAASISKRWTSVATHTKSLLKCTDIMTMFAPHWRGGHKYAHVWRTMMDHIDTVSFGD